MEQQPSGVAHKDSVKASGNNGETEDNDDVAIVEMEEDESKRTENESKGQELSYPDIPYSWSCYDTVEDVQALLESLATQGIRESALKKSLCEKMTCITDGIKRESNRGKRPTKSETGEEDIFSSIKEELVSIAESLVNGNLAILDYTGLEKYKQAVHQASCVSDLASQLEKLLTFVLPQFYQGIFSKDKANSEQAKQKWLEEVKKATTVSRLHLLHELLDSTVIWDMSAENIRCKVCRSKAVGKTLILCDECNLGYHLQCLRPALSEVPEGHWSCPICKPTVRQSSRSDAKNYKEESGSEVEDDDDEVSDASLEENEDYCHTCGEDGELVCCDTCPLVFHKDCHQPPLRNIPRGAWSCWQCRQPKNKKQKNIKKVDMKTSKAARSKIAGRHTKQVESSQGKKITRKRSRSLSSEESGHQVVSKRTRRKHQPEASNDVSTRNTRRRTRAYIESDDDEEQLDSNIKSFYGRSLRRTRQQKVSSEDYSDDGDECDSETEVRTNRKKTRRNAGSRHSVSARRSTRKQRRISDSSEDHDDDTEDVRQVTNQRTSRTKAKRGSKQVSTSIDESDESGRDNKSKRSSRSNKQAVNGKHTSKRNKRGAEKKCQEETEISNDDKKGRMKKSDKDKGQSKAKLRNSSTAKEGQKEARNTRSKTQDNNKDKRSRVSLEMNACEKILRDVLLHEDSWPFAEAVNLREVPDYLQFVTTPMDLGTIREKLKCLEYPDVESFVADVRLVFSNSDKYNLESSFVGKAGKTLETYFEDLLEENFSDVDKKFKVQRQRK